LDLLTIQERMNRLFDEFFVQGQEGASQAGRWTPAVDIYETGSAFVLLAEVPGMEEKDLNIEISNNVITLKGERPPEPTHADETVHCLERTHGPFKRTFTLPSGVLQDEVKATLKLGLLKVIVPKAEKPSHGVNIESK
jgi:HSP20 family protein